MSPVVFLPWYLVLTVWALEYIDYELGIETGPFIVRHPVLVMGAIMFSVFVFPFPSRWENDSSRSSDMKGVHKKIRRYVSISASVNLGGALLVLALAYVFIPMKVAENPWGKFRAGFNPQLWLILVVFGALILLHLGAYLVTKSSIRMKWRAYLVAILSTCYTACFLAPLAGAVAVDIYKSGADPNMVPWIPYWLGILIFSVPIFGMVFFMVAGIVALLIRDSMDNSGPVG
jgi:hypothetical protein